MKLATLRTLNALLALGAIPFAAGCAADGTLAPEATASAAEALPVGGDTDPGDIVVGPIKTPPPPGPLVVTDLAKGDGWTHSTAVGVATDPTTNTSTTYNGNYWVFKTPTALKDGILPAATTDAVRKSLAASPEMVGDETIVVPQKTSDGIEAAARQPNVAASICPSNKESSLTKSFDLDRQFDYTKSTDGNGFTGSAQLGAHVKGKLTGTLTYAIKYTACFFPYFVFRKVTVAGNATVTGHAGVDGKFDKKWSFSQEIADPVLGTVPLPVIPIPITFSLPVTAGLDASAKAEVHANADVIAEGNFQIDCKRSGCDGFKSGSADFHFNGPPAASAAATMQATPWAEVDLKASLLDDHIAYGKVGVRASMPTELFAYAGNTCGDADGDGVNEFVSGVSLNTGLEVTLNASAKVIGFDSVSRSYNLWTSDGGFHMVANGGVFDPILRAENLPGTLTAEVHASMRPCWPYDDVALYNVAWGDGQSTPISYKPHDLFDLEHTYDSVGARTVSVTMNDDIAGRDLRSSTSRSMMIGHFTPLPF